MDGSPAGSLSAPVIFWVARRHIRAIWKYITRDSVRDADLVKAAILATRDLAGSMPQIGHRRPELSDRYILFLVVNDYDRYCVAYSGQSDPVRISWRSAWSAELAEALQGGNGMNTHDGRSFQRLFFRKD